MEIMGFPTRLIWWIKACVSSPMFSVSINGELNGYFKGRKGLRQGDPFSPYLFVICMEVLSRIIKKKMESCSQFRFHWRCEKTKTTHLCFADHLMLFSFGNIHSVGVLKEALDTFTSFSGLVPNLSKSDMFITGVDDTTKDVIAGMVGFKCGSLPMRYLGVPLLSSKLRASDCMELENRILRRLKTWTNRFLSYSGRLQLIQSVLFSIQSYWCFQFILPVKVVKSLEAKLRAFLWKGISLTNTGAKVAWEEVTRSKKEGGPGIKKIKDWNRAAIARYIWLLCDLHSTSLWAKWVYANLLARSQLWVAKVPWDCSWSWRKILQLRPLIQPYITYKVGDGCSLSLWFDPWMPSGPICDSMNAQVIYDSGLSKYARVVDIIMEGRWAWPRVNTNELMDLRLATYNMPQPDVSNEDKLLWNSAFRNTFSVKAAWEVLREHQDEVDWHSIVWFKYHVPRYSFILWLAIRHRLSTQDKHHGIMLPSRCFLCEADSETHSHLFFKCSYSARLWYELLKKLGLQCFASSWEEIISWCVDSFSGNTLLHILGHLAFTALVYFLWREHNARLFDSSSHEAIILWKSIEDTARLRVMSCKPFPRTDSNRHLVQVWSLSSSVLQ